MTLVVLFLRPFPSLLLPLSRGHSREQFRSGKVNDGVSASRGLSLKSSARLGRSRCGSSPEDPGGDVC